MNSHQLSSVQLRPCTRLVQTTRKHHPLAQRKPRFNGDRAPLQNCVTQLLENAPQSTHFGRDLWMHRIRGTSECSNVLILGRNNQLALHTAGIKVNDAPAVSEQ